MAIKTKQASRGLRTLLAPVRGAIYGALALAAIGAAANVAALFLTACLLGGLIEGTENAEIQISSGQLALLLAVCTALSLICRIVSSSRSHMSAFNLEELLRQRLAGHLGRIPMGFAITHGTGALKKILMDDVKNLHAFVADSIPFIGRCFTIPVISTVLLFYIDWRLALVTFILPGIGVCLLMFVMRDAEAMRVEYDCSQEKINNAVIEFVQGMPIIRTFDDGSDSFQRFTTALEHYKKATADWLSKTAGPGRLGIFALSPLPVLVCVAGVGLALFQRGELSFTAFFACLLLCGGIVDCVGPLMWLEGFIKKSQAAAFRIQEILEIPPLPVAAQPLHPQNAELSFHDVTFCYEGKTEPALENISFTVPQGSITALVGPSGSGKSTIVRLVPRFWDVAAGAITLGGVDIRQIAPDELMNTVSFVFQDNFMFRRTIAYNLRIAKPEATINELHAAARAANIHDFILSLPDGYETLVDERGTSLSGGQKQRLAIARAMLRNAPILLLDEPTSFADPESEEAVIQALGKLIVGKTVIIVAHRLSVIQNVDRIVVLDKGRIAEQGTHKDLHRAGGVYQRLWEIHAQASVWNLQRGRGKA